MGEENCASGRENQYIVKCKKQDILSKKTSRGLGFIEFLL